ncbi:hypothetical protein PACILC2_53850 [Paenibacillus cisolokensis]|uniref:Uncharacterized protein n=1 Tax=Paenibacillus cisolokensis TaxID=1658519 RepID=A0ABQ4NF57_9BACL|nr:hypothetical protein [Paenibacillus cisolokensis]GIQ66817.1 hypothetical protein PACILC2_53850 [Paenibacillus cisolokensis]
MNIYEALRQVPHKKRLYFCWKHGINWDQTKPSKTEEEFLKSIGNQTLNGFLKWEKTEDYRRLTAIYLDMRFDNDLEEIYESLSKKAREGDEKSIKLLLQLGKDIKEYAKDAAKEFEAADDDEDDDLQL